VDEIDPATKKAAELTSRTSYEAARLLAEEAIIAYSAAEEKDKASNLLKMEHSKRAANRAAEGAGLEWPYPESGIWFN